MIRPWFALLMVAAMATPDESYAVRKAYVADRVDDAIAVGAKALAKLQKDDGSFPYMPSGSDPVARGRAMYEQGVTALAVYTLLWCDVPVDDPAIRKGLDFLVKRAGGEPALGTMQATYEISLISCALGEVIQRLRRSKTTVTIPEAWADLLQRAINWLVKAQSPNGGWWYQANAGSHDHSNTQFAIMGLRAAHNAGVKAPALTWERELTHLKGAQLPDGGWDYGSCGYGGRRGAGVSAPSMTAAGIMGTAMGIAAVTGKTSPKDLATDPAIRKGLKSLADHAKVRMQAGAMTLDSYWLYSLERACMLTGVTMLGEIDWYVEGAWTLLKSQQADGLWGAGGYGIVNPCFALLFLKRAYVWVETPSGKPGPKPGRPRETE